MISSYLFLHLRSNMGFSLKAALAALVALAINFGCEVGLSEGAGIPGSDTALQVWSSPPLSTPFPSNPTPTPQ
ncbi:hypothetical protein FRC02_007453 [Tulasnella sp. 418]|nr:hypothetical protein FRC02_007453 [Tulasnella sp. 418]